MQSVIRQWYESSLQGLLQRKDSMPHAILLTAADGSGKEQFATILITALLCKQPSADNMACGRCQSCQLFAANTHPDFYRVELLTNDDGKLAKEIKVDQVRQLSHSLTQTSQLSGRKIALINPADKMNRNAANSLLKTLEEPTDDTVLILLSAHPSRLLPTIRSRCQKLTLKSPGRPAVIDWLRQHYPQHNAEALFAAADGAPFAALELAEKEDLETRSKLFAGFSGIAEGRQDPVTLAAQWAKCDPELAFRWLRGWIRDLISLASGQKNPALQNIDLQKDLHALVSRIDLRKLFCFYDQLQRDALLAQGSANIQLVYEALLLEWANQCAVKS
ncbi:MAG: DNA polymerase III subunit delta' [Gammaproteobacteria bacterium]|nr:DNA polymerase III subunit delta' [Gammaproteobacteria bacterium]